jgi:hypothetical protein
MEKSLLIKIAKKLSGKFKRESLDGILSYLQNDIGYREFNTRISGDETVFLIFLISAYNLGEQDLDSLYDNLKKNVFAFSILHVDFPDSELICKFCQDGLQMCDECDGRGEVDCERCDGSGEVDDETCEKCGGDGEIDCKNCEQGYITCDNCDGNGYVEDDEYANVDVQKFFSYDSEVYYYLRSLNSLDKMDDEFYDKYFDSELTFLFSNKNVDTDVLPKKINKNDVFFGEIIEQPRITKYGYTLNTDLDDFKSEP